MTAGLLPLDTAVRHLLRNLDDADALRSNRLVVQFFAAQSDASADRRVLGRIRRELESLAENLEAEATRLPHRASALRRQRTILEACDLAARPHKVVAAELGLERRQFYRERKRLRRRIAEWLSPPDERSAGCIDRLSTQLAYLHSLRNAGSNDRLIRRAMEMFTATEGDRRREVGNLLIEAHSECGQMRQAEELAASNGEWGRAYVAEMQGCYSAAAQAFWCIVEASNAEMPSAATDELRARAALEYAQCSHMMGDFPAARRGWQMAGGMLARGSVAPSTRIQTLWQLAAFSMMTGDDVGESAASLDRALLEAVRHDLPRESADILIARANLHRNRKEIRRALEDARDALDLAQRVFGENAYAWRALNIATIELAARHAQRAIDLVHTAARARGANPVRDGYGEWIESSALLAAGKFQAALPVSMRAVKDLRVAQNQRHLGASLRIYAEAAARTRHRREAIEAIDESVELLSHYGLPNARANALRSRAEILNV